MGHVYRERMEIPRPVDTYINHSDGRVYIFNSDNNNDRTTIGIATSETMMHPNDTFRLLYPELWDAYFSKYHDPKGIEISVGLYGMALGSSYKNGLYTILIKAYGPLYGNAIMDYCMYSILDHTDVTQHFAERMKNEVLFSDKVHDDAWYSNLFAEKMTSEMHDELKKLWLKKCISSGMKNLWLCIDGSNNDCQMEDSAYAEPGFNKSHTQKPVVGYIYAIDAQTGTPVTYFVNPGGEVDSLAFQKIISFCDGYSLSVEGVILDRGFCTHEVVTTLNTLKMKYVLMTPHNTLGHTRILNENWEKVFWNPEYLVNGKDLYGISKREKIWVEYEDYGFFNLYFQSTKGSIKGSRLNEEVGEAKIAAEKKGQQGQEPTFPKKLAKFFDVVKKEDGTYNVSYKFDEWKKGLWQKGFSSILTSEDFGPKRTNEIYSLRIASETQYRTLKSEEGFDTTRVHCDSSVMSKYAICFVASIMRHTIMTACEKQGLDTNDMIKKSSRIVLLRMENGSYTAVRDLSVKARTLFSEFEMNTDSFVQIAMDYTKRKTSAIHSQVNELPKTIPAKEHKRGRKPGSKNKKTLEREAAEREATTREETPAKPERGKPGRKKGSKDTKPRKKRCDAGIPRGPRKKREETAEG